MTRVAALKSWFDQARATPLKTWLDQAGRWAWKWRWVLVMNAYLISPVFAYELRIGEGGPERTLFLVLPASVLWLLFAQLLLRRIWITHALMAPLYLSSGVDLYIISNYHTRLASNMLLTIVENFGDAHDFVMGDFKRTVGRMAFTAIAYGYALWRIRDLRVTLPRSAALVPLGAVMIVYYGAYRVAGYFPTVLLNDRNSPFGVFSQAYLMRELHQEELRLRELAKSFHFHATRPLVPSEPELYVLVVGESARRHNFSLYGYPRETNPRLAKLDHLLVFRDVLTQVAQTQVSVPLMLTRGTIEDPRRTAGETSIVSVFHEVGFRTHWLSTQQRDTAMAAISRYTAEADVVRFFDRRHDIVLVDAMKDILAHADAKDNKLFFMLHTLGSHFNLSSRYPREFAKFADGEDSALPIGASAGLNQTELIGAYDNTILYTDHVLSELVELIRARPGIKALLYIPDHGDNLRDDARALFGHAHSNEYDVPIPMLFWYSDEYAARFPDKVAAAQKNLDRPLNTRTVFYSLADMAGVKLEDPQLPKLSAFSPELSRYKRMVFGIPQPFDFDEWMARTGTKIPRVRPPNWRSAE